MSEHEAERASESMPESPAEQAETQAQQSERMVPISRVEEMIQTRLGDDRRRRSEHPGISNDALKVIQDKANKYDELKAERMSELEKANERTSELERALAETSQAYKDSQLRAAVVSEAAKRNVVDPDAALALLDRSLLEEGEDGSPTNIADAMDSLLTAKPYLVGGGTTRGSADLGARGGPEKDRISREQLKNMSSAEIVKAQNEGRLDHLFEKS